MLSELERYLETGYKRAVEQGRYNGLAASVYADALGDLRCGRLDYETVELMLFGPRG